MESACAIQEILLQSECNFMLVIWIEGSWMGTSGRGHNFLLSYYLFRGMQIKLVSILVQFVISLHRFSEEVSYGDFKASSNIKLTQTHCTRMKPYSNTK